MATLLIRLAGPMQSWGTESRFSVRETGREPSKSGVIGLICAALGRPRDASLSDLVSLSMGVREDRPGVLQRDYQTAGGTHRHGVAYGVARADGKSLVTVPSNRYFLADSSFLVGLEGDCSLLREINDALDAPVWPLCLGRKSFVPSEPVRLPDEPPLGPGVSSEPLLDALRRYPWPGGAGNLRFVLDAPPGTGGAARNDVPISFALGRREFASRTVRTEFWGPLEPSQ